LRHCWVAFVRGFFFCATLLITVCAGTLALAAAEATESVESIKATIEQIEHAVGNEDATAEELAEARPKLNAAADDLRAKIEDLEPRLREIEERFKELGPAPEKEEPPESAEIAKQRQELTTSLGEVEGALKQARVLLVHIDQLSERVAQKRHALYARELFARSASAVDPFFWVQVFHALPI
jgi:potassium efflux system protein